MRRRNVGLGIVALAILLPVAVVAVFVASFDPNRYAPALIAAVQRATGRQLVLGGPIHLQLSLHPTVAASDVSLENPPGFADANLLTLQRLEARISLLPLLSHHLDISDLVLVGPNLVLEKNPQGEADWDLSPAPGGPAAAGSSPAPKHSYQVTLEAVEVQNGLLTVKGPAGQALAVLTLTQLTGTAASGTAPLNLTAQADYNATPVTLSGTVGSVALLSGTGAWPVDLALSGAGVSATVQGDIAAPRRGRGYDVKVNATIPALETVAPLLPPGWLQGQAVPPLRNVSVAARIVDQNSAIPAVDALSIKAGAADLSAWRPGLSLTGLDIEMASLDQPITIAATGASNGAALAFNGSFGAVQSLFDPALLPASMPPQGSFPVSVQARVGTATMTVTGAIATPAKLAGVALATNVNIPDLAALSPAAGVSLPPWKNIALQTTVIDPGGLGIAKAAGLDGVVFSMDHAALGGAASLYFGAQPRLQAAINIQQMDLDQVRAGWPASPPPPVAASPVPGSAAGVIPAGPLPFGVLRGSSADIQLAADSLVFDRQDYTAIEAHAVLADGVLTLNPVTGEVPGGSVAASATVDTRQTPPLARVTVDAPALALAPFLQALGLPDVAQGTMAARLRLAGAGASLHDMAAAMNGQVGLAMVNGIVDGSLLDRLFGAALGTVGLPASLVGAQGPVAVRCFGLAVDASDGVGTIKALTLDSSRLLLQGGGTIDFGPETLAVVLRPQLRLAGNSVAVPVQIGGSFAAPSYGVATGALIDAASSAAGGLANAAASGGGSILGSVAAAIGLGGTPDVCPDALQLARLGQAGPAAPAVAAPAAGTAGPPAPAAGGPKNLLNALFGK